MGLVLWTAASPGSFRQEIQTEVDLCLRSNHTNSDYWFRDHLPQPNSWQRAMGSANSLKEYAKSIGQCWIRRPSISLCC